MLAAHWFDVVDVVVVVVVVVAVAVVVVDRPLFYEHFPS